MLYLTPDDPDLKSSLEGVIIPHKSGVNDRPYDTPSSLAKFLYLALDDPDLNPPLKKEGNEVAENLSEETSGRSREVNGESSASRRTIFETVKSKERKQILHSNTMDDRIKEAKDDAKCASKSILPTASGPPAQAGI